MHHLGTVSKIYSPIDGTSLTLISDVDQDKYMFGPNGVDTILGQVDRQMVKEIGIKKNYR